MPRHQPEQHLTHRTKWLRAAVMGANDGIVSTASLLVGVFFTSLRKVRKMFLIPSVGYFQQ